jgi:hypothetical protein
MTDQQHTTIVPRDLMRQMREQAPRYRDGGAGREEWLIERAAGWGCVQRGEVNEAKLQQARDQELKECCEWLKREGWEYIPDALRAARRQKPSLKEQACKLLECYGTSGVKLTADQCNTICRALEELPDG